ncbi:MAG: hypothetical protein ACREJ5_02685, partial [Geminicoccaceae bacterium]
MPQARFQDREILGRIAAHQQVGEMAVLDVAELLAQRYRLAADLDRAEQRLGRRVAEQPHEVLEVAGVGALRAPGAAVVTAGHRRRSGPSHEPRLKQLKPIKLRVGHSPETLGLDKPRVPAAEIDLGRPPGRDMAMDAHHTTAAAPARRPAFDAPLDPWLRMRLAPVRGGHRAACGRATIRDALRALAGARPDPAALALGLGRV